MDFPDYFQFVHLEEKTSFFLNKGESDVISIDPFASEKKLLNYH